jgi:hypothetical protein
LAIASQRKLYDGEYDQIKSKYYVVRKILTMRSSSDLSLFNLRHDFGNSGFRISVVYLGSDTEDQLLEMIESGSLQRCVGWRVNQYYVAFTERSLCRLDCRLRQGRYIVQLSEKADDLRL